MHLFQVTSHICLLTWFSPLGDEKHDFRPLTKHETVQSSPSVVQGKSLLSSRGWSPALLDVKVGGNNSEH